MKTTLIFLVLAFVYSKAIFAQSQPIVVELYTSQGCSSCPLADRILSKLNERENIITLSCHVTYWNHLGWQDSLSISACDQRQEKYRRFLNKKSLYTPQMIINGHSDVVGSQKRMVDGLLEKAAINKLLSPIKAEIVEDKLIVNTSNVTQKVNFIELFYLAREHSESIKRGENAGRKITYTRPVLKVEVDEYENHNQKIIERSITVPALTSSIVVLLKDSDWNLVAAGETRHSATP